MDLDLSQILKLLSLAIAPGIAIGIYVWYYDREGRQGWGLMGNTFFIGFLSLILALLLDRALRLFFHFGNDSAGGTLLFAFLNVSLTEEFAKFFFLRWFAFPKREFREPYDGILFSVIIAMGFATFENLLFVFFQPSYYLSVYVGSLRMVTAIPMHASMGIIMGYFAGLGKFRNENRTSFLLTGFLAAVILHGAYDYFIFIRNPIEIWLGGFVSLAISLYLSVKAFREHHGVEIVSIKKSLQRRKRRKK